MKLDIKAKNLELTAAIRDFAEKKIATLDAKVKRFGTAVTAEIEVGKTSKHHKKGEVFRAEVHVRLPKKLVYAEALHDDLYTAIGNAKKEAERQIMAFKGTLEAKTKRKAAKGGRK
jgi:putative sigma-54 modulation protein